MNARFARTHALAQVAEARKLLASAGANPGNLAYQQSTLAQVADMLLESAQIMECGLYEVGQSERERLRDEAAKQFG